MKISIDKSHKELTRRIIDRKGTYTIPYIQSCSELSIKVDEYDSQLVKHSLLLMRAGAVMVRSNY